MGLVDGSAEIAQTLHRPKQDHDSEADVGFGPTNPCHLQQWEGCVKVGWWLGFCSFLLLPVELFIDLSYAIERQLAYQRPASAPNNEKTRHQGRKRWQNSQQGKPINYKRTSLCREAYSFFFFFLVESKVYFILDAGN